MAPSLLALVQNLQAISAQPTAGELIAAYHHDGPMLFLSAAFITVAVVAAGFSLVRRRFDPLLLFLAMFAYLYGQRLRFQSEMLSLTVAHSAAFLRLRVAINYLVPIPAFAFFEAAGFLGRWGKWIVVVISLFFLSLIAGVFVYGPLHGFDVANALAVVLLVPALVVRSQLMRDRDPDFKAVQLGVICFVGGSLWDNIAGIFIRPEPIEPYCFAIFLATLGYVAARRLQRQDGELAEVRSELELAQRIQLSLLPAALPASPHFRVAARYQPMTTVAGDLYEYLLPESNGATAKLGILIADVSGHGVPAALIASMVKMAADAQSLHAESPAMLLTEMNRALCGNTQDQFVTAAYAHLDAEAGVLHYSAAGHPAMLQVRDGHVEEIVANGFPLGIVKETAYDGVSLLLAPRDRMILYTDGLPEARNADRQLFGDANLHRVAAETAALGAEEAAEGIMDAVRKWSHVQDDDLTVIVCDFLGN